MFGKTGGLRKLVAVADIGSGGAAVAILAIHGQGPATVIASNRATLPFEERTEDAAIAGILSSLADAGQKVLTVYAESTYKKTPIGAVYAIIRAPWTHSKTERVSSTLEKDMRITGPMIAKLAQQAVANDSELDRGHLIESSVVRVELNGYPTASPVGKLAHQLSVVALISDCNAAVQSGVTETLQRTFPHATPTLRSGARALLSAVRVLPHIGKDYLILDVESEASTILVVRDGLTTVHTIVLEGVRSILKRISEKGLPEETLSLLRMVERNECSGDTCDAISTSIARVEIDLARVYGEAMTHIATPTRLPTDLVLITHPNLSPWLATFFSRIDFTQFTLTAQPFAVRVITQKDLLIDSLTGESSASDIELSIATALVNTEEQA